MLSVTAQQSDPGMSDEGTGSPASPRRALIYTGALSSYSYGPGHPFKPERYRLAYELMEAYGLVGAATETIAAYPLLTDNELLAFHDAGYLARLREFSASAIPRADFRYGLGDTENPVFPGMYDWALAGASGTAEAARLVLDEGYASIFHLAGGWHHAHRARASGFSYLNDAVFAINRLVARGKRVAYLDVDAHHGDGVQEAFYDTDRVLTISLHQSGLYFFPGTGFEHETGTGAGRGYSVNVPFLEHAGDRHFLQAVEEIVLPLLEAFAPDVLVTQLGADSFRTDPLSLLEVSTHGYTTLLRKLKLLDIPWIGLAGGGYDNFNVARAWTLVWSIMNGIELPARLPESFITLLAAQGGPPKGCMLADPEPVYEENSGCLAGAALEKSVARLRHMVFPLITGKP